MKRFAATTSTFASTFASTSAVSGREMEEGQGGAEGDDSGVPYTPHDRHRLPRDEGEAIHAPELLSFYQMANPSRIFAGAGCRR